MNEGNRIARERCVTGLMNFKLTKEVIEMNMPGFTAEASLYNVNERYQATAQDTVYGGLVQPAGPFSDRIDLDQDRPYLYRPSRWNCLKWVCDPREVHGLPYLDCRWVSAIC